MRARTDIGNTALGRRSLAGLRCSVLLFAATVAVAGCAGTADSADDTPTTTTTAAPATTTTTAAPTTTATSTTTTTVPQTPLEALGYPVSDDWVIETVFSDIDAATGGLAIDEDGFFYQADFGGYDDNAGNRLLKIAPDGSIETLMQNDDLASLTMTTIGPDGAIYQTAYGSGDVLRVEKDGSYEIIAEGLRGPTGIVAAEDGTLYVDSFAKNVIYRISPDGTVEDWIDHGAFWGLNGLTVGPDGTLYVINFKDGGLFSVAPDGTVTNLHKFPKPTSHGVYHDGSLFVTARSSFVVFRYDLETGDVEIIIGNAEYGTGDGRGSAAQIGRPNAITVGPDGALYINHGGEKTNNPVSIRRISYQPQG